MNTLSYSNSSLMPIGIGLLLITLFNLNDTVLTRFEVVPGVSLLFLPAFLKMAAVALFRWQGVFGLFLGFCFITDFTRDLHVVLIDALVFCVGPMAALLLTQVLFRIPNTLAGLRPLHIMFMGIVAASIQSIYFLSIDTETQHIFSAWTGDVAGALITLFALSLLLRCWERFTKTS